MIEEKKYEIVLTTKGEFRIGGKQDPFSGIENPVAVVGNKVVVPGSSLKGAYRAELERYLIDTYFDKEAGKWEDVNMQPCIPATKLSRDENHLVERGLYRYYNKRQDRDVIKGEGCHYPCDTRRRCRNETHAICPVCYLLGANGLNGFVKVPFLSSDTKADELYSASIDRAVGTVKQGTNRPYQIVPTDTVFKGSMIVTCRNDILDWTLGKERPLNDNTKGDLWLKTEDMAQDKIIEKFILERIKSINVLGGFKSKGCGAVEIKIKQID